MNPLIVIPARLQATRLPGKPLADIGGVPMIAHVLRRALESGVGPVLVACDGEEIAAAIHKAGGQAVITDPNHPSGSDRIFEAITKHDPKKSYDIIINLQGDVPTLEPRLLRDVLTPLENPAVDIATLVTEIKDMSEHTNPSVVKAVVGERQDLRNWRAEDPKRVTPHLLRGLFGPRDKRGVTRSSGSSVLKFSKTALYFTRSTTPYGDGPRYHHIGVYAYRRAALERFVALPPSPLELREKLEQLRALESGMRIDVTVVDTVPLGVDTPEDLEKARRLLQTSDAPANIRGNNL